MDKAIEAYELWRKTYPRDSIPANNLAVDYAAIGKWDQALVEAQETVRLAPNAALSYQTLAIAYLGLNRLAESKAIRQKQIDLKVDTLTDHRGLYSLAFLEGDTAAMQHEVDWAKGKPDEFIMLENMAEAAASAGKMQKAREIYSQAVDSAQRRKFREAAAGITARYGICEARIGNLAQASDRAFAALAMDRSRATLPLVGVALSLAGDVSRATMVADELSKRFPTDTSINNISLPIIRAGIEISRDSTAKAIESLRPVSAYEFGLEARVVPTYVRGQAYLKAKQGQEAAVEFQKILDHRGICATSAFCILAHLQLGRARALAGDKAGARIAYQDFLALWKDADPDIPTLKAAKAEYAKLPQ